MFKTLHTYLIHPVYPACQVGGIIERNNSLHISLKRGEWKRSVHIGSTISSRKGSVFLTNTGSNT